jgi:hypothetical protein
LGLVAVEFEPPPLHALNAIPMHKAAVTHERPDRFDLIARVLIVARTCTLPYMTLPTPFWFSLKRKNLAL